MGFTGKGTFVTRAWLCGGKLGEVTSASAGTKICQEEPALRAESLETLCSNGTTSDAFFLRPDLSHSNSTAKDGTVRLVHQFIYKNFLPPGHLTWQGSLKVTAKL